ncbi:MAG: efflux RND transporter periplasmic adaptor subunit [Woeseiaceae bacterium]
MNSKRVVSAVFIACFATVLTACGIGVASPAEDHFQEAPTPLPVQVAVPRSVEIFAKYHTTANIGSDADAPIPARVKGEIVEILVEEGDWVEKDQVLGRVDGERLRIELKQAKANLEKTVREYERFTNLHQRGLVSTAALDDMKFDVDALNAHYELKKLDYDYTSIRATISGVVSARYVKTGQHINSGDDTFRVTNPSELVAYLQIPQSELSRFAVGNEARVQVDSMPNETFGATIRRISPTIDARNGTFRATAYIENDNRLLAPGMFGRFEIAYEKHTEAMVIPVAAVIEEDNVAVVYVVEDGTAVRKIVTTGIEDGGQLEILSGLAGDERIIVTGQKGLRNGSKVLASLPLPAPVAG